LVLAARLREIGRMEGSALKPKRAG
jgi:hypothetical protein